MVLPLYIASGVALLSQVFPATKKETIAPKQSTSRSLFYSGLLSGLSLGYILTTELQRRRIWDYGRLFWRKHLHSDEAIEESAPEDGMKVEDLVCPQTNLTPNLHVQILTIPPKQRIEGKSLGVECYVVLKGTLHVNDAAVVVGSSNQKTTVVEPFMERTLYNPSSSRPTIVYRATDGVPKDNSVVEPSTVMRLAAYVQSQSQEMATYTATSLSTISSTTKEQVEYICR